MRVVRSRPHLREHALTSLRMTDADILSAQADAIRASGILGRSSLTQRLFDFLIDCSLKGKIPKEIEVAIDAFGRGDTFDVSQDAVVRVYIHKLRRKLEEFYAGPGKQQASRIVIPRGEYRLAVAPNSVAAALPDVDPVPPAATSRWYRWAGALLAVSLLINLVLVLTGPLQVGRASDPLQPVRESALWAPLLDDELPIYVVTGDYYIFGEVDQFLLVTRLIRDFNINSRDDFERALQNDRSLADKYQDLNLAYLPTASAFALRDVMPVLALANRRVHVVMASDVNADVIKSGHVIYIGYFSGMATLREVVFAGSRLMTGESFDELYDRTTGTSYVSDVGSEQGRLKYRDYGYVSTFAGPGGNQFVILAGTRDIAVMRTAEITTQDSTLRELRSLRPENAFEALYEVYGFGRTDIDATLVFTAPLDTKAIWRDAPATQ
jgi:hypothetical protein